MNIEIDTVNPTHLLMIDYIAKLEKKVKWLESYNAGLLVEKERLGDILRDIAGLIA